MACLKQFYRPSRIFGWNHPSVVIYIPENNTNKMVSSDVIKWLHLTLKIITTQVFNFICHPHKSWPSPIDRVIDIDGAAAAFVMNA